jgi:hypothetical protein
MTPVTTEIRPQGSPPAVEALIEEARRHRRRRHLRILAAVCLVGGAALVLSLSLGGSSGGGGRLRSGTTPHTLGASGGLRANQQTAPPGTGVVGRGPTSIDFLDADHGWIASSDLSSVLGLGDPTIVRTDNGGATWQSIPVPKVSSQTISAGTRRQYGGIVNVTFADAQDGWYEQAGMLWHTTNGGRRWTKVPFDTVIAFAASGHDQWALANTCPVTSDLNPCSTTHLFHSTLNDPTWRRYDRPFSIGPLSGGALAAEAGGVVVSESGNTFGVTPGHGLEQLSTTCEPIGSLAGGRLAGLCGIGGGGDASVTSFATSANGGKTWNRVMAGPPSPTWSGTATTNGVGTLFSVTGGTTLWRSNVTGPGWSPVLRTPAGTQDEIYPVTFSSATTGVVLESDGSDAHFFQTRDGGLTWSALSVS